MNSEIPGNRKLLSAAAYWRRRATWLFVIALFAGPAQAESDEQTVFKRIQTQYIAALGDPQSSAGRGAESWGLWTQDPGPRGVWLGSFKDLKASNGVASAGWKFDPENWWLDENGLIMEKPDFPVPPGQYVVTGNRETTAILTIYPTGADGTRRWELDDGASLHDVTHLRCRSARYVPAAGDQTCSPSRAQRADFPVEPGGIMPKVDGCAKQDYSVLFVIGKAVED